MPSGAFDFPRDVAHAVRARVLMTAFSGLVHKICSLKIILQKFIKTRASQIIHLLLDDVFAGFEKDRESVQLMLLHAQENKLIMHC